MIHARMIVFIMFIDRAYDLYNLFLVTLLTKNLLCTVWGIGGFKFFYATTGVIVTRKLAHTLAVPELMRITQRAAVVIPALRAEQGGRDILGAIKLQLLRNNFVILFTICANEDLFDD